MSTPIPIHDFAADNKDSVPFRYIQLGELANYDFSLPHRHNYYEIFFFSKGGGNHFIDFKDYAIENNSVHFVSPGQVHVVKRALDSYGSIILFSRDFFYSAADVQNTLFNFPFLNNSQYPILSADAKEYETFELILSQVQNESGNMQNVSLEILRSYLKVILLKCLQLFDVKYPDHQLKQGTVFNSFREMVEKEYRAERQPAHYAAQLHITEKKLNEICKENTGENVSDYIRNRVMLEAKRLLIHTEHNIKEIAYFLGFEDPSYFNRFFRANENITAGDFRKAGK
jgi:AraC family transcriptional activator of pobA